jgi:hypothetical protein
MNQLLKIFFLLCVSSFCNAQNCIDKNLSKKFNFNIYLKSLDEKEFGKANVVLAIFDKATNDELQIIRIESEFIFKSKSFIDCSNNVNYLDNVNNKKKIQDNDFGDFIIADFNFDGKEDIALKHEEGGNGGPLYNFYLQDDSGRFERNKYLSGEMMYFPHIIDSKNMELRVYLRMDSTTDQETVYAYINSSKTWKIIERTKFKK